MNKEKPDVLWEIFPTRDMYNEAVKTIGQVFDFLDIGDEFEDIKNKLDSADKEMANTFPRREWVSTNE